MVTSNGMLALRVNMHMIWKLSSLSTFMLTLRRTTKQAIMFCFSAHTAVNLGPEGCIFEQLGARVHVRNASWKLRGPKRPYQIPIATLATIQHETTQL